MAFARSLNHIRFKSTDGEQRDNWLRGTMGFHKVAGEWKIVHEHYAVGA